MALRARAARAARGGRRRGAVRRGVLHVQRGGRLADPLPPRRLEGAVLPGGRGRARRRRLARRPALRREPARPPPLVRQAQGPEQAEWARRLLLVSLRLRALVWRHGAGRARFARGSASCRPAMPGRFCSDRLPPPRGRHGSRAGPGRRRGARARAADARCDAGLGARSALRRVGGRLHGAREHPAGGPGAGADLGGCLGDAFRS